MDKRNKSRNRTEKKSQGRNPIGQVPMSPTCGKINLGECRRNKTDNRYFHWNEVGHIKRNYPRLRIGEIVPMGGQGGGNARPRGNHQGNQGNMGGNGNDQR